MIRIANFTLDIMEDFLAMEVGVTVDDIGIIPLCSAMITKPRVNLNEGRKRVSKPRRMAVRQSADMRSRILVTGPTSGGEGFADGRVLKQAAFS